MTGRATAERGIERLLDRSEHLGGVVGPGAFTAPAHVLHHDVVYARGCPIGTASLRLRYADGTDEVVMRQNAYCII